VESDAESDAEIGGLPPDANPEVTLPPSRSKWSLWVEVLFVFAVMNPYLLPHWILPPVFRWWPDTPTFFNQSAMSITAQLITAALIALVIVRSKESWSTFGLRRPRLTTDLLAAGLLYILTAWVAAIGNDFFREVLRHWFRRDEVYVLFRSSWDWLPPSSGIDVLTAAVTALCIGFSDEFVYRGYLIPRLERLLGWTSASVIVSAVLFAYGHWYLGIDGVWNAFIIGLVFGSTFACFRNLWPLVIAHGLIDFVIMLRHGTNFP
jgi:membrane protease YdiL (CAAX protease family)